MGPGQSVRAQLTQQLSCSCRRLVGSACKAPALHIISSLPECLWLCLCGVCVSVCVQVDGGPRILSLQLDRSGRRLLLTATDSHIRIFLLHRPGDRQLLRGQQRLALAAARKAAGGEPGNPAAPAAQQPLAPADWQVHSLESAAAAAAAAASAPASRRHKNSLFFDDSSAWLTWHLDFTPELSRRQWKCAAFTPGAVRGYGGLFCPSLAPGTCLLCKQLRGLGVLPCLPQSVPCCCPSLLARSY